jgi:hypothetical protein
MKVALLLKRLGLNSTLVHSLGVTFSGPCEVDKAGMAVRPARARVVRTSARSNPLFAGVFESSPAHPRSPRTLRGQAALRRL